MSVYIRMHVFIILFMQFQASHKVNLFKILEIDLFGA